RRRVHGFADCERARTGVDRIRAKPDRTVRASLVWWARRCGRVSLPAESAPADPRPSADSADAVVAQPDVYGQKGGALSATWLRNLRAMSARVVERMERERQKEIGDGHQFFTAALVSERL